MMDTVNLLAEIEVLKRRLENAVEVVRCKECKHWWVDGDNMLCHIHYDPTVPEHFCSYGERGRR